MRARALGERGEGIDGGGGGGARRGHDGAGDEAARDVGREGLVEGVGAHGEALVDGDAAHVVAPEAGEERGLLHGAVAVRRRRRR